MGRVKLFRRRLFMLCYLVAFLVRSRIEWNMEEDRDENVP